MSYAPKVKLALVTICVGLAAVLLACGSDCSATCSDAVGLSAQASPAILGAARATLCQNSVCVDATTTFEKNEPAAHFVGPITAAMSTNAVHTVGVFITAPATAWHDGDVWSLVIYDHPSNTNGSTSAARTAFR